MWYLTLPANDMNSLFNTLGIKPDKNKENSLEYLFSELGTPDSVYSYYEHGEINGSRDYTLVYLYDNYSLCVQCMELYGDEFLLVDSYVCSNETIKHYTSGHNPKFSYLLR